MKEKEKTFVLLKGLYGCYRLEELCIVLFLLLKFVLSVCSPHRYFLRVTIVRRLSDLVKEYELIVHQLATYPDVNNSIKMEVGIEDCLHIEFEYNKSK